MPPRVLAIGVWCDGQDPDIKCVETGGEAPSLFDYDIVVVDIDTLFPSSWNKVEPIDKNISVKEEEGRWVRSLLDRLARETRLLLEKEGMLVCLLRPTRGVNFRLSVEREPTYLQTGISYYQWIPIKGFDDQIMHGTGSRMRICDETTPFSAYLRLPGTQWVAYLDDVERLQIDKRVIAMNDAGKPVALEAKIGGGRIVFLPVSEGEQAQKMLVDCVRGSFESGLERPAPSWVQAILTPRESEILVTISALHEEMSKLQEESESKSAELRKETKIKKLLYEKGEPLAEAVKEGFQELGFTLTKRDDMDWVASSNTGETILEVTGSDGSIDIDKLRQLLDYVIIEYGKTRTEKKAILVGNHFANDSPENRGEPFTKKVLDEAEVHSMCLLPTVELFRAICLFREGKTNDNVLRKRIFDTIGVFQIPTM
jgi:hypothetical protein